MSTTASHGTPITPSDTADLEYTTRAVWVGAAGSLRVTTYGGDDITLKAVPAGTLMPVGASKVWATGTSAADLVGLW